MRRFFLPVILFILFIFESVFVDIIPPESFNIDRFFVPRFVMVVAIFMTIYFDRLQAIYYAIGFGLLFDIIYTDLIGIYMFSIPLVVYLVSLVMKVMHSNLFIVLTFTLLGVSALEFIIYGLYLLIGKVDMYIDVFLYNRLFPTLVLNGVFVILIFYPLRRFLNMLQQQREE